jgi:3-dehydroquinate synthase
MQCAAWTSRFLGLVDDTFVQQQTRLLDALHLPLKVPAGKENELVSAMHHDKKVSQGRLRLVLPTRIGHVELFDSPGDDVLRQAFAAD